MKVKKSTGERIFQVFNYIFLTIITLVCLYPMWHVAVASFSNSNRLMSHTGFLLKPLGFSVQAYIKVFENPMILKGYLNTLFILITGVILDLILTSLAAYFFSRKNVLFKKPLMLMIMFTMFFSGGTIPFYLTLRDLHMIDSRWGLIIPFMISTYNMIIMRTSFEAIPESLTEAARIDGAGHITILVKIILPLSKAILAVLVLYYAVGIWNAYFDALIYLRDASLYPLQIVLRNILLLGQTEQMGTNDVGMAEKIKMAEAVKYSAIVVSSIPMLLIYPFVQKYFVKGVMIGAVKG